MDSRHTKPGLTQLVLYSNDAVEACYSDGSKLYLAPCATTFLFHQPPPAGQHPIHGGERLQQRSQFVTSAYRTCLAEANDFRNRFAERPYLCTKVVDPTQIVRLHAEIWRVAWPEVLSPEAVDILPDGSLRLSSSHQHASVTLAPCKQFFTVRFVCRTSQAKACDIPQESNISTGTASRTTASYLKSTRNSQFNNSKSFDPVTDGRSSLSNGSRYGAGHPRENDVTHNDSAHSVDAILNEGYWDYIWTVQYHSVLEYPDCWKHPIELLLQLAKKNMNTVQFDVSDLTYDESKTSQENDALREKRLTEGKCVYTSLPSALPVKCPAPHLHKRRTNQTTDLQDSSPGRIKVFLSQGIIYRCLQSPRPAVEIYPGDGTILRSSSLAGHYFTHFIYKAGKVEEKVHSVSLPPPDLPGAAYSIKKLITRGARFLENFCEETFHGSDTELQSCCWKAASADVQSPAILPSVLLEECDVRGVGRFTAHSSGRVRVVFSDRTSLDTRADFSPRVNRCREHSLLDEGPSLSSLSVKLGDLSEGVCRLLLPNGHYQLVQVASPGPYQRYIQAAQEWIQWVNSSPGERTAFYKDTLHDPDRLQSIDHELRRIKCFNYIVENTVMSQFSKTTPEKLPSETWVNPSDIRAALKKHSTPSPLMRPGCRGDGYRNNHDDFEKELSSIAHARGPASVTKTKNDFSQSAPCDVVLPDGSFSLAAVRDALAKTSQAIQQLDMLLSHNGETAPTKQ